MGYRNRFGSTHRDSVSAASVLLMGAIVFIGSAAVAQAPDRLTKVKNDKTKIAGSGEWIYNDFSAAQERARADNKPLLVVLRCIP